MEVPQVYIVVVGYTGRLQFVREGRITPNDHGRPIHFTRLSMQLLRPAEIEEILRKTQVERCSSKTITDRWKLATKNDVMEDAQYLLKRSSGNPRVLINLLMDYCIRRKLVDLTQTIEEIENERVTPARILRCCRLEWEGTLDKAKLHAPPEINHEIVNVVYPFRDYARYVSEILDYCTEVFTWMCIKRWSDLFSESCVPKTKLPAFFKESSILGDYAPVRFSEDVAVLPQMKRGESYSSLKYVSLLNDATRAYADHLPQAMREICGMLDRKKYESFCYKFRPQSESPNAFLVSRSRANWFSPDGATKHLRGSYWATRTLAVGLVIKDVRSEPFDVSALYDECKTFDRMFHQFDYDTMISFGVMTNVLVLCVIGCSDELRGVFGENGTMAPPVDCKHISEVLLLDLTTPEKREKFFAFNCQNETQVFSDTVEKVVARMESEVKKKAKEGAMKVIWRNPSEEP